MTSTPARRERRPQLSAERVLEAAVRLADEGGLDAVSMRRIGQELGVEAMSLYHHVRGKEQLLDGMVETVVGAMNAEVGAVEGPDPAEDWRGALRSRALAARVVMLRHPWLPAVLATRTTLSPEVVRYHDAVVGILLGGGFDADLTHHALHALGSRVLGFTQELFDPGGSGEAEAQSEATFAALAAEVPHLARMLAEVAQTAHTDGPDATLGWCDDQSEFEFGLDVVLDGLELRRARR
jgi:AcrR family transcriptional regulator